LRRYAAFITGWSTAGAMRSGAAA